MFDCWRPSATSACTDASWNRFVSLSVWRFAFFKRKWLIFPCLSVAAKNSWNTPIQRNSCRRRWTLPDLRASFNRGHPWYYLDLSASNSLNGHRLCLAKSILVHFWPTCWMNIRKKRPRVTYFKLWKTGFFLYFHYCQAHTPAWSPLYPTSTLKVTSGYSILLFGVTDSGFSGFEVPPFEASCEIIDKSLYKFLAQHSHKEFLIACKKKPVCRKVIKAFYVFVTFNNRSEISTSNPRSRLLPSHWTIYVAIHVSFHRGKP